MHKRNMGTHSIRLAVSAVLACSAAANAQEAETNPKVSVLDEVVVTGSRIPQPAAEAASPVTVIGREAFEHIGDNNVIRELNKYPQLTPARSPTASSVFAGSFINLRGLGVSRTLTLVDGRRWFNALSDGGVDVASIPPELIERVDLLTGGASATYGADAVAGVANFVFRKDIEGLEFRAQRGMTARGENSTSRLAVTGGGALGDDGGRFYFHASYDEVERLIGADRDFSAEELANSGGQLVPTRPSFSPLGSALVGSTRASFNQAGELFSTPGVPNSLAYQDRYNRTADVLLQQPSEQTSLLFGADYPLNDWLSLYVDAAWARHESYFTRQGTQATLSSMRISPDSPFIGPMTQAYLAPNAGADGLVTVSGLSRLFPELGPLTYTTPRNSYRILAGSELQLGDSWKVDAYFLHQESQFTLTARNAVHLPRVAQALQVVTTPTGDLACRDPSNGCVPLNIFGAGKITPEMAKFIRAEASNDSLNKDEVMSVTATGKLATLPAGDLGVALGVESLRFYAQEFPDDNWLLGITSAGRLNRLSGTVESMNVFGEVNVPLLADLPFVHFLNLEGGFRYSDYDTSGEANTWKALLAWSPYPGVKLRGGLQRAIRQPTIFEQFAGDAIFTTLSRDPCFNGAPLTGALREACLYNGVSTAVADAGRASGGSFLYFERAIASPDLRPEDSDSLTVGLVFDDQLIPNTVVTVDYYRVLIEDAITEYDRDQILRQCFNVGTQATRGFCDLVTRDPTTSEIVQIDTIRDNAGESEVEGVDLSISSSAELGPLFGQSSSLDFSVGLNYVMSRRVLPIKLEPETEFRCAGWYGDCGLTPRFRGIANVGWTTGPVRLGLTWQHIGSSKDDLVKFDPEGVADLARTGIPSYDYFDLSFDWTLGSRVSIYGGVDNLLDKKPPLVGGRGTGVNTIPAVYDTIGQRFFLGTRVNF